MFTPSWLNLMLHMSNVIETNISCIINECLDDLKYVGLQWLVNGVAWGLMLLLVFHIHNHISNQID